MQTTCKSTCSHKFRALLPSRHPADKGWIIGHQKASPQPGVKSLYCCDSQRLKECFGFVWLISRYKKSYTHAHCDNNPINGLAVGNKIQHVIE